MERPIPQTKRQEWLQRAAEIQGDVNATLAELQFEIDAANATLAELESDPDADPDRARLFARDIVAFLDSKWEYHHHLFMVTGTWTVPENTTAGPNGITFIQGREDACYAVRSNGFMIGPANVDDMNEGESFVPRVGLSFHLHDLDYSNYVMGAHVEFMAFAEPKDISMEYLRPADNSVVSTDPGEVMHALSMADAFLELYTQHSGSQFYKLSAEQQRRSLDSFMTIVEDAMPTLGSTDKVAVEELKLKIFYYMNGQQPMLMASSSRKPPIIHEGTISGVTTLDMIRNPGVTRYGSVDDMEYADVGLCLIVQVDDANFNLPDECMESGEILVPFRHTGKLKLSVY